MAADALEPLYLITGGDAPKIGVALRRLRARFDPGSIDTFAAELNDAGAAVAAANALGLFAGGERLVVVEGVEAWKKIDVETITRYAESPAPGAVLALVGMPLGSPPASRLSASLRERSCATTCRSARRARVRSTTTSRGRNASSIRPTCARTAASPGASSSS